MNEATTYHAQETTDDPMSDIRQAAAILENPSNAEKDAVAEALYQVSDGLEDLEHHAVGGLAAETAQQWQRLATDATPQQEATLLNQLEAIAAYCRYTETGQLPTPERRETVSNTLWKLQNDDKALTFIVAVDMAKYHEAQQKANAMQSYCWPTVTLGMGRPPEALTPRQREHLLDSIEKMRELAVDVEAHEAQAALDILTQDLAHPEMDKEARYSTWQNVGRNLDLMDYREALYAVGVTEGFQWINGSFVEHVEARDRPGKEPKPYDIDVVTFYHQPDDQPPEFHDLFRTSIVRDRYNIDAFNLVMGTPTTNHLVESVAYWYGMWSTRREDQMPKGFVQVNLDPEHDPEARQALSEIQL